MNLARTLWPAVVALAALACTMPAAAQWAWRDAAGKMVYSDQPPPTSVPAKDIVRQPAAPAPAPADATEAAAEKATETKAQPASSRPPAKPAQQTVAERELESRRRQQQQADAEKKAAAEEARTAKIAENCERLRAYQRALDGGFRVARVNPAGERQILDDKTRAAESERTRGEIEQQCK